MYIEESVIKSLAHGAEGKTGIWQMNMHTQTLAFWGDDLLDDLFGNTHTEMPLALDAYLDGCCHPDDVQKLRDCLNAATADDGSQHLLHRVWSNRHDLWRHVEAFVHSHTTSEGTTLWGSVQYMERCVLTLLLPKDPLSEAE